MSKRDPMVQELQMGGTNNDDETGTVSNRALVIFFAALAAALVLGYLFLNKLVDISQEEDCMLAHRKNCGAVELPSRP